MFEYWTYRLQNFIMTSHDVNYIGSVDQGCIGAGMQRSVYDYTPFCRRCWSIWRAVVASVVFCVVQCQLIQHWLLMYHSVI